MNIHPLTVILTPDTMWSWISPLSGVPSLGTKYWKSVLAEIKKLQKEQNFRLFIDLRYAMCSWVWLLILLFITYSVGFSSGKLVLRKMSIHLITIKVSIVRLAVSIVKANCLLAWKNASLEQNRDLIRHIQKWHWIRSVIRWVYRIVFGIVFSYLFFFCFVLFFSPRHDQVLREKKKLVPFHDYLS